MNRIKKYVSVLLIVMLVITTVPMNVHASATYIWGKITGTLDDDGTLTVSGKGVLTTESAHRENLSNSMSKLIIEDGVTGLSNNAFSGCTQLVSVTLPDSLTSIGGDSFSNCTSLKDIKFPENLEEISDGAFAGCESLKSIKLPKSLNAVCDKLFMDCKNLEGVTIPDGASYIGAFAFSGTTELRYVVVPDSIDSSEKVYSNFLIMHPATCVVCGDESWLKTHNDYKNQCVNSGKLFVEKAGASLTYSYEPVSGTLTISGSGSFTKGYKFRFAPMVKKIVFKNYTASTFSLYSGKPGNDETYSRLTSITLPDSVNALGDYAFYGCSSLKELTISDKVTKISDSAFTGATKIVLKVVKESKAEKYAEEKGIKTSESSGSTTTTEKASNSSSDVPAEKPASNVKKTQLKKNLKVSDKKSGGIYKITKVTKKGGKVAGGTVALIKPYNKKVKKVTIPASIKIGGVSFKVTYIGNKALKGSKKLASVVIGKNVSSIGSNAFNGCKKLKTINIKSKKISKIGSKAFKGISSKAKFKVPKAKLKKYKKLIKKAKAPSKCKITK